MNNQQPLSQEGMKIIFCEVSNFMGIKHIQLDLGGDSVWLIGGNAETKSSLINALCAPLDSSYIPAKPIHGDEERGLISMKVAGTRNGEYDEYSIDIVFTPSNRTGTVTLKDKDGAAMKSPKKQLESIFGRIGFDVFAFLRADKKKQGEIIKKLAGCGEQLDAIDVEIKELEEDRKILKREIDSMQAVNAREVRPFNDDDIDKYNEKPPEEDAIALRLENVGKEQELWQKQKDGVTATETIIENNSKDVIRLSLEIEEIEGDLIVQQDKYILDVAALKKKYEDDLLKLEAEATSKAKADSEKITKKKETIASFHAANKEYQDKVDKANKWLTKHPKPTTDAIVAELADAREYKRMYDIIEVYDARQKETRKKQKELESKEDGIKQKRQDKIKLIENSQLPVKGLLITEDDITLDEIPIQQLNTETLLELGIEMSCAMNPVLKTIMIREGSLIDMPHMEILLKKLYARGYQVIVEYVRPEGGPLEIKFEEKILN